MAQASAELGTWSDIVEEGERTEAGYALMNDADKALYDIEQQRRAVERQAADDADAAFAGNADMSLEAQTVYAAEYLKWNKEVFRICTDD